MISDKAKEEIEAMAKADVALYGTDKRPTGTTRPVRIRYRGEWLVMPSGKTIWRLRSHAKNALTNSMRNPVWYSYDDGAHRIYGTNTLIGRGEFEAARECYKEAILREVEFVEVDEVPTQ